MNRKPKKAKDSQHVLPVWTYAEAQRLVPYLRSVMQSLRDHYLDIRNQELVARRLANRPGRPGRATLIAHQEAVREVQRAWDRYDSALEELHVLGIFCLDTVNGEALVPFEREDQRAWVLFDLFDRQAFRFWRFDNDDLDTRRPIREVRGQP
jgi:hypothetical protein